MPAPPLAILDGRVLPAEQATIPVTDLGLLRGDGVFEVVRIYEGRAFAVDDHLRRLARSAENLRVEVDVEAVRDDLEALLAQAGAFDGAVRFLITRGGRRVGLVETLKDYDEPVSLASIPFAPTRVLDGVKSLSYAGNMLANRLAEEAGADEALLVTPHGRVLEGPTSSLFVSLDGETLVTPPLSDHILDSITRRVLLELLPHAREEVVTREELGRAREACLVSTTREVQGVARIDDTDLPGAPGPLTQGAAAAFAGHVRAAIA